MCVMRPRRAVITPVEIPSEGHFLRGRLRVHIEHNDFGLFLHLSDSQSTLRKGQSIACMKTRSLQVQTPLSLLSEVVDDEPVPGFRVGSSTDGERSCWRAKELLVHLSGRITSWTMTRKLLAAKQERSPSVELTHPRNPGNGVHRLRPRRRKGKVGVLNLQGRVSCRRSIAPSAKRLAVERCRNNQKSSCSICTRRRTRGENGPRWYLDGVSPLLGRIRTLQPLMRESFHADRLR